MTKPRLSVADRLCHKNAEAIEFGPTTPQREILAGSRKLHGPTSFGPESARDYDAPGSARFDTKISQPKSARRKVAHPGSPQPELTRPCLTLFIEMEAGHKSFLARLATIKLMSYRHLNNVVAQATRQLFSLRIYLSYLYFTVKLNYIQKHFLAQVPKTMSL